MVGQQGEHQVRLCRDNASTPWGFRLQGGREVNAPLTIQRVFVGSVSEGQLHRGDIVVAINNSDVSQMYHKQAEDLIRTATSTLSLRVKRGTQPVQNSQQQNPTWKQSVQPAKQFGQPAHHQQSSQASHYPGEVSQYGGEASHYGGEAIHYGGEASHYGGEASQYHGDSGSHGGGYNNRQPTSTSQPGYDDYYGGEDPGQYNTQNEDIETEHIKSVGEILQKFSSISNSSQPAPQYGRGRQTGVPSYTPKKPSWTKPNQYVPGGLAEPGWKATNQPHRPSKSQFGGAPPRSPPINRPPHSMEHYPSPPREEYTKPAWAGTLKGSGGSKQWEMKEAESIMSGERQPMTSPPQNQGYSRGGQAPPPHTPKVQTMRYGPGGQQGYEQHSADNYASDTAQVKHLQYNTPIGLYSKKNAQDALKGQTYGKPGQGSLQIKGTGAPQKPGIKKPFDPANSSVLRMLMEEEESKKQGGAQQGNAENSGVEQSGSGQRAQRAPQRPPPQQTQSEGGHSARFLQLVHENDDQQQLREEEVVRNQQRGGRAPMHGQPARGNQSDGQMYGQPARGNQSGGQMYGQPTRVNQQSGGHRDQMHDGQQATHSTDPRYDSMGISDF